VARPEEIKGGKFMEKMEKEVNGGCPPCEINMSEQKQEDCILFQDYLTDEEEAALSTLRRLKKESHEIISKIRRLEEALELVPQNQSKSAFHKAQESLHRELGVYFQQLERLRDLWNEWKGHRELANRRKMVLLGYGDNNFQI